MCCDVFITAPNIDKLRSGIEEIVFVGKKGGFKFKEWIVLDSVQLPGAASADEEKALGVHCDMEKDELVSHGGPVRYSHKFNAI